VKPSPDGSIMLTAEWSNNRIYKVAVCADRGRSDEAKGEESYGYAPQVRARRPMQPVAAPSFALTPERVMNRKVVRGAIEQARSR
jgi:hypothetical protein